MSFLRYSLSFMSYKGVNVLDLFIHTPSYWELHPSTRIYRRVWWGSGETGVLTGRNTVSEASGGGDTSVPGVPQSVRELY